MADPTSKAKNEITGTTNFTMLKDMVAERCGISRNATRDILAAMFEIMTDLLIKGESISIYGFGRLEQQIIGGYTGKNFKGETIEVAPRRCVRFRPSAILQGRVKYRDPTLFYDWHRNCYYHEDGSPVILKPSVEKK